MPTNPKDCGHNANIAIEDYVANEGKRNQEPYKIVRCAACGFVLSVIPHYDLENKFMTVFRDLAEIKTHLARIAKT